MTYHHKHTPQQHDDRKAAIGFGLHLSRGQRRQLRGLDFYRFIHTYTRKLQSFTLVVVATYLLFLALFLVGMLGNGREGNEVRGRVGWFCEEESIWDDTVPQSYFSRFNLMTCHVFRSIDWSIKQVTPQSLPLHESALLVELFLALLIIWGVRQPLGGPTSSLTISAAATAAAKTRSCKEAEEKGATLVWSSPRKTKRQVSRWGRNGIVRALGTILRASGLR